MKPVITLLILCALSAASFAAPDLKLWFTKPAIHPMDEALPIGNGRMGGLICGDPAHERVVLNEDSLWTGDANPSGDYGTMGAYQTLGDLHINLDGLGEITDYKRDLDLQTALATVSFKSGGVRYKREYLCSHPDKLIAIHLTASVPGQLSGEIDLKDAHKGQLLTQDTLIRMEGLLDNGLEYRCRVHTAVHGGAISAQNGALRFTGCDSVDIFITASTSYTTSAANKYGLDPTRTISIPTASTWGAIIDYDFERLKTQHVHDFQALFNRVNLDLGQSTAEQKALPTDLRKIEAAKTVDPELESLMFQYGRYLLISCSRPGGLPANLQGLWNDSNTPAWNSDYHTNINVQMNYWPAEVTNLPECHLPFFDLIKTQIPEWRIATARDSEMNLPNGRPTQRGWALRTSHNIFGGMGWRWDHTANAWYCQHLWEHYAFTLDRKFLADTAYPILKEVTEFWEDHLKQLPDGQLVVPNAWSPEHGPTEDGVSYSQEIVWDLFSNYIEAAKTLGVDPEYQAKVRTLRDHLATPGVGSWGQLLEWMTEKKGTYAPEPEIDTPNDHHRHTSHLFAVYPGKQIGTETSPKLAAAAKVSLDARGETGDVREWSFAWRTALYGRLHDGESAHRMFQQLFSARNTCPNLFGLHPPMQMDGNFGITAAIPELLVQSHEGDINLLPALPTAWPTGSIHGIKARGDITVSLSWKEGKLQSATLQAPLKQTAKVRYGNVAKSVVLDSGKPLTVKF